MVYTKYIFEMASNNKLDHNEKLTLSQDTITPKLVGTLLKYHVIEKGETMLQNLTYKSKMCVKHVKQPLVKDRFGLWICTECEKEVAFLVNELKSKIATEKGSAALSFGDK
jgi:ribosomal protein L37AE/L43A